MTKKHIVSFGYQDYAFDSITAATKAIALFSSLKPVRWQSPEDGHDYHYAPDTVRFPCEVKLELNQPYRDPATEKPKKAPKALALPKPARGTIRCICEKSDVAPKQSCPHCGRPFSESHNRTHSTAIAPAATLRLL